MKLSQNERLIVEALKKAQRIRIVATMDDGSELNLAPRKDLNTRKLFHDIALSVQDFFNNNNRHHGYY